MLATAAPRFGESERASLEREVLALLLEAPEVFEHRDLEPLRETLGFLSLPLRRRALAALEVTSFAEPDEAWALYDLCPCLEHAKRLLRVMPSHGVFFAGPGAFQAARVLAAQPDMVLPEIAVALSRPRRPFRHVLAAALALMHGDSARAILDRFRDDRDVRVQAFARHAGPPSLVFLKKHGIDPRNRDYQGLAKGGVVGTDGKRWRGNKPFRSKR
jgi:hypothetical protein